MERIYFDNAATSPIRPEVIEVMTRVMKEEYGNPSSTHANGRSVRVIIEEARRTVAKLLKCTPGEIFFTSGGTEADNMSIRQAVSDCGIKNIITSPIEHHAVLHTIEELDHKGLAKMHMVKLGEKGHIDYEDLEKLLKENKNCLVSLMYANNELGNLIDADRVGALCKQYGALFHTDTVQAIGHYPIDLSNKQIHFLAGAAHKFNGPKGVGFIYINNEVKLKPFITGGSQERNMRGGTENVYGIAGLAKALQLAYENMEKEHAHLQDLKTYFINQLKAAIPGVEFNGDAEGRSSFVTLNVSFPPTPVAEMLLFKLDIAGISASGGSACSSGSNVGSHVLSALGTNPDRPAVRFSFGYQNTHEEVDRTIQALKEILQPAGARV